jgi:hypothetical protein
MNVSKSSCLVFVFVSCVFVLNAGTVALITKDDVDGDGVSTINVSNYDVEDSIHSCIVGDSWGGEGLKIGRKEIRFTMTEIVACDGKNLSTEPSIFVDMNGLGIDCYGLKGDKRWFIDPKEALAFKADNDLKFVGITFRSWNGQQKEISIRCDSWKGLQGLNPSDGIQYKSSEGLFIIKNNPIFKDGFTVGDMIGKKDAKLPIKRNTPIRFENTGGGSYGFTSLSFSD